MNVRTQHSLRDYFIDKQELSVNIHKWSDYIF
jgi:hypothetical protein